MAPFPIYLFMTCFKAECRVDDKIFRFSLKLNKRGCRLLWPTLIVMFGVAPITEGQTSSFSFHERQNSADGRKGLQHPLFELYSRAQSWQATGLVDTSWWGEGEVCITRRGMHYAKMQQLCPVYNLSSFQFSTKSAVVAWWTYKRAHKLSSKYYVSVVTF